MDARESRFRIATEMVIRSSRTIGRRIGYVKSFYLGDPDVPVPPLEDRLETILNPKSNGACKCIDALCEAAKEYRPGEYPAKHLDFLKNSAILLIQNEIEPIQRTKSCNLLTTLVNDIYNYLAKPKESFSMAKHVEQLDNFRTQWSTGCCQNSDAFYEMTSQLLKERKASAKPKPPRGKKSRKTRGKGPQTEFKRFQREIFMKFLERKPITASVSRISRAHQCWLENKAEWDAAAENGSGYCNHKSLARAI